MGRSPNPRVEPTALRSVATLPRSALRLTRQPLGASARSLQCAGEESDGPK